MKSVLKAIVLVGCLAHASPGVSQESGEKWMLGTPLGSRGTVSFILYVEKGYRNGAPEEASSHTLLQLPGLASFQLQRDYSDVFLTMQWENDGGHRGYYLLLTELPGPETYHLLFTWDADKGWSDGYFNGTSFRLEDPHYYRPWEVTGTATEAIAPAGPSRVTDVQISSQYTTPDEAMSLTPTHLRGKGTHLLGQRLLPPPMDVGGRKGKLLYASKMNSEASMKGWILEGPGIIDFADESMIMRSQIPNPPDDSTGHFNYWCPERFPADVIVEWEFKPYTDHGVSHLFFASTGQNGEDIFAPSLPRRDGHFKQYIDGLINNYYVIYFSNRRIMRTSNMATTWLAKSAGQSVLALGQIGVPPDAKTFHRMTVIKDGGHIQIQAGGRVYLDFTDPGSERWGDVLGGGSLGFRQMAVTMAAYRNLRVWELLDQAR